MKKPIRKKEEIARDQYTVVLEELNSKMDFILEDRRALNAKVDFLMEGHAEFKEFKEETRDNFRALAGELHSFKTETKDNFKVVLDYLSRTDDRIESVENELQSIKVEIKGLKLVFNDKVGLDRIIVLEQKVNILEDILKKRKLVKV